MNARLDSFDALSRACLGSNASSTRQPSHQVVALLLSGALKPSFKHDLFASNLASQERYVVTPLRRDGHSVISILCTDAHGARAAREARAVTGSWRPDLVHVRNASTTSQWVRMFDCWGHLIATIGRRTRALERRTADSHLMQGSTKAREEQLGSCARRRIDWIVRSRPDLHFFEPPPPLPGRTRRAYQLRLSAYTPSKVHLRVRCAGHEYSFRHALSRETLSWWWEQPSMAACLVASKKSGKHFKPDCAVFDDQFALVPQRLHDAYFQAVARTDRYYQPSPRQRSYHNLFPRDICSCAAAGDSGAKAEELFTKGLRDMLRLQHSTAPLRGLAFRLLGQQLAQLNHSTSEALPRRHVRGATEDPMAMAEPEGSLSAQRPPHGPPTVAGLGMSAVPQSSPSVVTVVVQDQSAGSTVRLGDDEVTCPELWRRLLPRCGTACTSLEAPVRAYAGRALNLSMSRSNQSCSCT